MDEVSGAKLFAARLYADGAAPLYWRFAYPFPILVFWQAVAPYFAAGLADGSPNS